MGNVTSVKRIGRSEMVLCIYLQLFNIIAGPEAILKLVGLKFDDIEEIGMKWFTTTINSFFLIVAAYTIFKYWHIAQQIINKSTSAIIILIATCLSYFLVKFGMQENALIAVILNLGLFIKVYSIAIVIKNYELSLLTSIGVVLQCICLAICLYIIINFSEIFSFFPLERFSGLFNHANTLGQFASFSVLVFIFQAKYLKNKWLKRKYYIYLLLAFILILFSQSVTSLVAAIIVIALVIFESKRLIVAKFLSLVSLTLLILIYFSELPSIDQTIEISSDITGSPLERDLTLTGRTAVWNSLVEKIKYDGNEIFGYGIGGFWSKKDSPSMQTDNIVIDDLNQSHNGLLEIVIDYGLVGLLLFSMLIHHILKSLSKKTIIRKTELSLFSVFISLLLINNLTEASFLQIKHFYNFFLILFLLFLFTNKKESSFPYAVS